MSRRRLSRRRSVPRGPSGLARFAFLRLAFLAILALIVIKVSRACRKHRAHETPTTEQVQPGTVPDAGSDVSPKTKGEEDGSAAQGE